MRGDHAVEKIKLGEKARGPPAGVSQGEISEQLEAVRGQEEPDSGPGLCSWGWWLRASVSRLCSWVDNNGTSLPGGKDGQMENGRFACLCG